MILVGISSLLIAVGVTWAVTPLVIRLADRMGAIDLPGLRKTHSTPMPRIGGLGVFLGFTAGIVSAALATGDLGWTGGASVYWPGLAFAASALMLVGLWDDIWGLSFHWKFAVQIVAAIYVWQCGFQITNFSTPLGGGLEFEVLSLPLTVLWIVGITNAVNLIDGLDGLASGIALITTLTVAVIAFVGGHLGMTAASVALAGALIGFLPYNFNPARIFLGDSGSLFLGFVLAVTSVRGSQKGSTFVAILVPLLVLGVPLLDTSMAVLRRLVRLRHRGAESDDRSLGYLVKNFSHVFLPDREHLHHRLLDVGLSHRRAVLVLYGMGGLFAFGALGLVTARSLWLGLLLVGLLVVTMAFFMFLLYLRIVRVKRANGQAVEAKTGEERAAERFVPSARGQLQGRL